MPRNSKESGTALPRTGPLAACAAAAVGCCKKAENACRTKKDANESYCSAQAAECFDKTGTENVSGEKEKLGQ